MSHSEAQVWKSHRFSVEAHPGNDPGTVVFRFEGPWTARDLYSTQSPKEVREIIATLPANKQPSAQIFDLSSVPYMDSVGLGMLVGLFVSARSKGIRMSVTGCTPRVLELFQLTKVDSILPIEH